MKDSDLEKRFAGAYHEKLITAKTAAASANKFLISF